MKKLIISLLSFAAIVSSCSNEDLLSNVLSGEKTEKNGTITLSIEECDEKSDVATRTASSVDDGYVKTKWEDGDVVGICSNTYMKGNYYLSQIPFVIDFNQTAGVNSEDYKITPTSTMTFMTNNAWSIKDKGAYYGYYPYDPKADMVAGTAEIDYTSQTSKFNMVYLPKEKNYMVASRKEASNGNLNMSFTPIGGGMTIKFTGLEPKIWKKVRLYTSNGKENFFSKGTINIKSGSYSVPGKTSWIDVNFESNNTPTNHVYCSFMLYSSTLGSLKAEITSVDGYTYITEDFAVPAISRCRHKSITVDASSANNNAFCNGHKYVDLGLRSGLKWADCNIGAEYPLNYGSYFGWAETKARDYKDIYNEQAYHFDSYVRLYDKAGDRLRPEHDAAVANWGEGWSMPSQADWDELYEGTIKEIVDDYQGSGIPGMIFRNRIDRSKSIFLPAVLLSKSYAEATYASDELYSPFSESPKDFMRVVYVLHLYVHSESYNSGALRIRQCTCHTGNMVRPVLRKK